MRSRSSGWLRHRGDVLVEGERVFAAEAVDDALDHAVHQPGDLLPVGVAQRPDDAFEMGPVGDEVGLDPALDPADGQDGRVGGIEAAGDERLEGRHDLGGQDDGVQCRPGAASPGRSVP